MKPRALAFLGSLPLILGLDCFALELAPPFTDHAVLQRDVAVPVWGWDDTPGADVTVSFAGQVKLARVNASGVWRADLDPLPATAEGADLVVTRGSATITLRDVVVGEVWLASGQSNMEWTTGNSRGFDAERARPADPLIRHLRVEHAGADLPVGRVPTSGWRVAAPDAIGEFSAVGYFFAREISGKLRVPVGIINASWGGTAIESWMPEPVLRISRNWTAVNRAMQEAWKDWPARYAAQPGLEAAWARAWEENRATGKPVTMEWPRPPVGPGSGFAPARLYNGMIAPFAPYALRGALWYQGESNVGHHRDYAELLPAMIAAWRATWPLGDFPFLVVQLPNYVGWDKEVGRGWAYLREAQESVLHVPAAAFAVTIDGDEPDDLHPRNKQPVGDRLARIALHRVYDRSDVAWSGPVVQAVAVERAAIRVTFSHAEGLQSRTPEPGGFEIAGHDRVFHPATARIEGQSVVASAAAVPEPVAVRYAFANTPAAPLVNAAGLPAAPFRTDRW